MMLSSHHRYARNAIGKLIVVTLCSWALSAVPSLTMASPADETYHYREVTGETIKEASWQLVKGDTCVLTYSTPTARYITTTRPDYDTIRWQLTDDDEQTDLWAERRGDIIAVRGRFRGQPVDKRLTIDDAPWYQATSLCLRGLVAGNGSERTFWTIRLGTLTAHKIRAVKQETSPMNTTGGPERLLRIRLTLPGIMAPFWKSNCWFELPGGVFYRFEGPSGPPGTPTTVITRISK